MILTALVVAAVVVILIGVWLNQSGEYMSGRAFGGLLVAVLGGFVALMFSLVILMYSIETPVGARQLEARYDLLYQAISQEPTLLTAASVLEASRINSEIVGWRRWERSAWIGWWYADLRPDVQVLSLKGGTHD